MKYFVNGEEGDFIQDSALIEYYKFNNMRHTVVGCMLGDFDKNGVYHVSEEIVKELIMMPKYFVETIENIDIVSSELKLDKQISFMVTYENDRVTLSLIEKLNYEANFKINSGAYSNISEYVIDEVVSTGSIDKNVIYDRWHIKPYGGQVVDIFNCGEETLKKYFGLVNRFKYLLKSNRVLLEKQEEIENIEADYTMKMFEILKRYPKLEEAINNLIVKSLNEKKNFISIDKPYFAKTLNEILDKGIRELLDVLTPEEQENFLSEYHNCLNEINIRRLEIIDLRIKKINLEKTIENYLITMDVGEYQLEDLIEIANAYVMVLKSGKLNPRFDLIWFLMSIGVLESSIGYEKVEQNETLKQLEVEAKKKLEKKVEKSAGKTNDSKKVNKKDTKKDNKKGEKKDVKKDAKKDTEKKDDKKGKDGLLSKAANDKKRKIYFFSSGSTSSNPTPEVAPTQVVPTPVMVRTGGERRIIGESSRNVVAKKTRGIGAGGRNASPQDGSVYNLEQ